jgi:F-type H+-transporting ATPase subunit alpha
VERKKKWETDLVRNLTTSHPELGKDITEKKQITPDTERKLRQALEAFKTTWL